jgi:hypothetical protein
MSLNQVLINNTKPLDLVVNSVSVVIPSNPTQYSGVINVVNINNSSYGYSDARARFSKDPSDISIDTITYARLSVERKYMAHRNSPEQFDPVNYVHYKGSLIINMNAVNNKYVNVLLDVSSDNISDRNDTNGDTVICYSGYGQQISPQAVSSGNLQINTIQSVNINNGKLLLPFFNTTGQNILPSTTYQLDFDICIETL